MVLFFGVLFYPNHSLPFFSSRLNMNPKTTPNMTPIGIHSARSSKALPRAVPPNIPMAMP